MMKKILLVLVAVITFAMNGKAQSNIDRLSLGFGCLYQNGLDLTLSYEHEGKYHHMWEFFANGYLKWDECASCGHICPESFWRNFRSYGFGVAYKPCVAHGRNHYGNVRIGARLGVTQNGSWAASTSAMNTIMCFEVAGGCSAR